MGLMDKAKGAIKGRSSMIEKGIDVAADQVNKRSKGKYASKVNEQASKLKAQARQMDQGSSDAGLGGTGTQPGYGSESGYGGGDSSTRPGSTYRGDPGTGGTTPSG